MPLNDLDDLQAGLLGRLADTGQAVVSADALSLALAARCHEEVRGWVEDFARAYGLDAEEEANGKQFRLRVP